MAPLDRPSTVCWPRWPISSSMCTGGLLESSAAGVSHPGRTPLRGASAELELLQRLDGLALDLVGPDDDLRRVNVALGVELDVLRHTLLVVRLHERQDVRPGLLASLEGVQVDRRAVEALSAVGARRDAELLLVVGGEGAAGLVGREARAGDDRALGATGGTLRERGVVQTVRADELGLDTG